MAKALSKSQVAAAIAEKNGITKKQAAEILDSISELAYKNAKNTFTLPGLGKLVLVNRAARVGRNPATGETIQTAAKRVVKFRVAKVAKEFGVPAVLTAVETESFSGYVWPQLLDVFPGQPVVERTSMNSWDDPGFRAAIEATGKKNILMTGLWTEVCVTWPTIEMLGAGYNIYVVEDCCGATSSAAQEAALSRMVQAGAVRLTTIGALLE